MKQFAISFLFAACISTSALAGGGGGAGAIDYQSAPGAGNYALNDASDDFFSNEEVSNPPGYFSQRHKIALEYAFDSDNLKGLIEDAALKASLASGGVPPNVTDITLAIKSQVDRIEYADKNGLDLEFWASSVAEIAETVLVQTIPGIDAPLTAAKITAAFVTAYLYGFCCGN